MIIVMGTPGAGKSTVIREFIKRHPSFKVLNFGTLMMEIAQRDYGVENRDDMRKLRREDYHDLQVKTFELIRSKAEAIESEGERVILDTHASVHTVDGYYPGFPFELLSTLTVESFIYIRCSPATILRRRIRDRSRKRDIESIEEIQFHDTMNISFVCSYAAQANVPVKFIINEDGKLEEAIREFEDCVRV